MSRGNPFLFIVTLILACCSNDNLTQGVASENLVASYSFSGNAKDGSGHGYDGTVNGAVLASDRFGNTKSAYQFNGTNAYVSLPGNPLANANYSYSMWVFLTSIPSPGDVGNILSIGDNTSKHQTVNVSNDYASAGASGLGAGGFNVGTPSTTAVQTGIPPLVPQWYHLVVTRDNNIMSFYVNSQLIGTSATDNTAPYYGSPVLANIGARCNLIQFFQGVIDDVFIYNRALTAQEVQLLYMQK